MTWKEFKNQLENEGVKDSDEIGVIDVVQDTNHLVVYPPTATQDYFDVFSIDSPEDDEDEEDDDDEIV